MELRKNCELIEVVYQNKDKKAVLTFLDVDHGQVLEVNFNKQSYKDGKFVDDAEKEQKVEEWSKTYFDTTFSKLGEKIGTSKDVYVYDNFNSLWESTETKKFTKEMEGKIFSTQITRVEDDGKGIHIYFNIKDDEYSSKMMYAQYIEAKKEWFNDPQKERKQKAKFEEKFGVSVENASEIIGNDIMVEGKMAFGKFPYAEIKTPNWD